MSSGDSLRNRVYNDLEKSIKLDMIGELVAGFVHEIRNPLTSILGFVQLLEQGSIKQDYFNIIHSSFHDIEEYLKELLIIAKPQPAEQKIVNIKLLVENVIELVKHKRSFKNIHIFVDHSIEGLDYICDPAQIKMVIKHLVMNSIEAIHNDGIVTIEVWREDVNLLLKITDNGVGMSRERLAKLGEPSYSLTENGTGIGLMICYRIICQYNGSIYVESEENKGTTVEVRLPLSIKKASDDCFLF